MKLFMSLYYRRLSIYILFYLMNHIHDYNRIEYGWYRSHRHWYTLVYIFKQYAQIVIARHKSITIPVGIVAKCDQRCEQDDEHRQWYQPADNDIDLKCENKIDYEINFVTVVSFLLKYSSIRCTKHICTKRLIDRSSVNVKLLYVPNIWIDAIIEKQYKSITVLFKK
jgi:hypothetical protein